MAGVALPGGGYNAADDIGVGTYKLLKKIAKGSGDEVHHLIEKRFRDLFGDKADEMMSIIVDPKTHQELTNAWRDAISYGKGTANATREAVENAARKVYKEYPEILDALGL